MSRSTDDEVRRELEALGFIQRCVAFLDFLGFRKLVEQIEGDPQRASALLKDLRAPRELYEHLSPHFCRPREEPLRITAFSDSIVVSSSHPYLVTHLANSFYGAALYKRLLIRGGIAIGTLYHDDEIVLGSAMIRAYEIESTIAHSPRVVVDDQVVERAHTIPTPNSGDAGSLMEGGLISRDHDRRWILDPFAKDNTLGGTCPNWVSVVRDFVAASTKQAALEQRSDLVEKYKWLDDRLRGA